jgi:hypothetical protein
VDFIENVRVLRLIGAGNNTVFEVVNKKNSEKLAMKVLFFFIELFILRKS